MGQGISEILTFAVGVAISPVPIVAVILMLFSQRARINGPAFLVGWVLALGAVSTAVYALSDASDASTNNTASDAISWERSHSACCSSCSPCAPGASDPDRAIKPPRRNGCAESTR